MRSGGRAPDASCLGHHVDPRGNLTVAPHASCLGHRVDPGRNLTVALDASCLGHCIDPGRNLMVHPFPSREAGRLAHVARAHERQVLPLQKRAQRLSIPIFGGNVHILRLSIPSESASM